MKRIFLPLLLSTAYLALMTSLFSSDLGRENNFLFEKEELTAKTTPRILPDTSISLSGAPSEASAPGLFPSMPEGQIPEHSPESAAE